VTRILRSQSTNFNKLALAIASAFFVAIIPPYIDKIRHECYTYPTFTFRRKIMNLDLFKQGLIMKTANSFSWEEIDSGENSVALRTFIPSRKYNTEIAMTVEFNEKATLVITFAFDSINYNKESLALVNYFNQGLYFFKAYVKQVRRGHALIVEYASPNCDSVEQASETVQEMIDRLFSDSCAEYLLPLTAITEA